MSRVKSPQQVLSRVVKEKYPKSLVLTIMPCYDKKLEAIRFDIEEGVKEVDITITTTELLDLYNQLADHPLEDSKLEDLLPFRADRLIYE